MKPPSTQQSSLSPSRYSDFGSATGSDFSRTAYTSVKMAVLAPMPKAMVRITVRAKPGDFRICRNATRISCIGEVPSSRDDCSRYAAVRRVMQPQHSIDARSPRSVAQASIWRSSWPVLDTLLRVCPAATTRCRTANPRAIIRSPGSFSKAVCLLLIKRVAVLLLLVSAGCSAQTNPAKVSSQNASQSTGTAVSPELKAKIQRQVQAQYDLPPSVVVDVGSRRPSDIPTFDLVTLTLSGGENSHEQKVDFLLSQDGKTLAKLTRLDLTKDIYTERMSKIDVKGRPVRGNPNAKVTLVNYDDLQCPFCSRMHTTLMQEILPVYGDRIKIVYKDFQLSLHPWAIPSANDANCLAAENWNSFWQFADYVHANQKAINGTQDVQKSKAELDRIALDLGQKNGANMNRLQACIKEQPDKQLKASMAEGEALGLNATPTMYINGQKLEGAVDPDEVRAILNAQLLAAGVQPPAQPGPAAQPQATSK